MKLNKSFRYRLKPNSEQEIIINKTFGCCRFIYNKMLADKITYYEETKESYRNTPAMYKGEFGFLKEVDSLALANEQMNLETAFRNFFRNTKVGFPKFKSKKHDRASYITNNINNSIRIINTNHIKLPRLGIVKFIEHRRIPKDYIIKSVAISRSPSGKYFISILTEYEYDIPEKTLNVNNSLGLDYSSRDFYVDSQNKTPENYKHLYRISEDKLAKEQRKLSHMKLHSNNYEKQKIKIAKVHEKISNQRKEFIETLSTKLANSYDIICIEDLNLRNIAQSLKLGKSTNDNGFGIFKTKLEQKLPLQGKKLIRIDKWFPSSKTCRFCGAINSDLKLSDREWDCECGAHLLRDHNAAINILNEGLRVFLN